MVGNVIDSNQAFLFKMIVARETVAVLAAILGATIVFLIKKISHFSLCLLISFAAGALLAVTIFDLIPETLNAVGWIGTALSFLSGYVLFFLLTKYVFHVCPACAASHTEANFRAITFSMILALGVHSLMDGLAVYGSVVNQSGMGVSLFAAVASHKIPEGMALVLVMRQSGWRRTTALGVCVGLELLTTLGGGFIGFYMTPLVQAFSMGYLFGHIGGGFIFLVIHALLSEAMKRHPRSTLAALLSGGAFVYLASLI